MSAQAVRLSNVDIDNALRNRELELLFQPIFDLGNGALARMETFVRWRHPLLGLLPPGAFISFFETQGRMSELTRYVIGEALKGYLGWRGPYAPGFSINLATTDLTDEAFASHFAVVLRESGFPAELVTLECPMPPITMDDATACEHFQRLARTGARLAIEVRGRANDFLRSVEPFPFHEIKTGGAAILRFARTVRGPGLSAISELLELASKHNAAITAVGVEDQASLAALRGLGFAAAQGNHLGKVGGLSAFVPSRVNEVRHLLGLDPLSREDLSALFRTGSPNAAQNASQDVTAPQGSDALPDASLSEPFAIATGDAAQRAALAQEKAGMSRRDPLARPPLARPPMARPPLARPVEGYLPDEDNLVARLAERINRQDPPRDARADGALSPVEGPSAADAKAAAIARARQRAAMHSAARAALETPPTDDARAPSGAAHWADDVPKRPAPRDLQDRLSREFEALSDGFSDPVEPPVAHAAPPVSPAPMSGDDVDAMPDIDTATHAVLPRSAPTMGAEQASLETQTEGAAAPDDRSGECPPGEHQAETAHALSDAEDEIGATAVARLDIALEQEHARNRADAVTSETFEPAWAMLPETTGDASDGAAAPHPKAEPPAAEAFAAFASRPRQSTLPPIVDPAPFISDHLTIDRAAGVPAADAAQTSARPALREGADMFSFKAPGATPPTSAESARPFERSTSAPSHRASGATHKGVSSPLTVRRLMIEGAVARFLPTIRVLGAESNLVDETPAQTVGHVGQGPAPQTASAPAADRQLPLLPSLMGDLGESPTGSIDAAPLAARDAPAGFGRRAAPPAALAAARAEEHMEVPAQTKVGAQVRAHEVRAHEGRAYEVRAMTGAGAGAQPEPQDPNIAPSPTRSQPGSQTRTKRAGTFLSRTVIRFPILSGYFWPRSVRRAFRQWSRARADARAAAEAFPE